MNNFTIPAPVELDMAKVPVLRWGIIGAAAIAETWLQGVRLHTRQQVLAVASRTPGKAQTFAQEQRLAATDSGPGFYDSYEELLAREDIDAVYIATLPTQHAEHALLAIAAGKHVLIEKPTTMNSADAARVFAASSAAGVFCMEAMWSRYLPQYQIAQEALASGVLGEITLVMASFCQDNRAVPRLWKPGHGDVLFDCGIYPISFAQMFLGNPTTVTAQGIVNADGIDEEVSIQLGYANGARAHLVLSGTVAAPHHATVSGETGVLDMHAPFFVPSGITITGTEFNASGHAWIDRTGVVGHLGLAHQVNYFASYVAAGLLESPVHSHADTVAAIELCEEICRQIGANPF